jgi:hypothetical protein
MERGHHVLKQKVKICYRESDDTMIWREVAGGCATIARQDVFLQTTALACSCLRFSVCEAETLLLLLKILATLPRITTAATTTTIAAILPIIMAAITMVITSLNNCTMHKKKYFISNCPEVR